MLVNDILDLAKIEAGQLDLEKLDFNPAELVDEITDTMRVLAENKGLKLYSTLAPDSQCMVNGDSGRLTQILANLISNAIKFTGSGEVNVYLHISDLNAEEKMLQFKVTDTGIGLSPDKQQNIFAAFAQTDNAMARNRAGSGLGLAISKKLIDLMDGEITIESKPGTGSAFTVSLRLKNANINTETTSPTICDNTDQSFTSVILLAEDNIINQEVATDMLEFMGHTVDIANNGKEAVQMTQKKHYDIVLMDCQMPVMDGIEASRELRCLEKTGQHRHTIIALTGNALIGDKEKCEEAGMDDFLSKPFSYEQLEAILTHYHNLTKHE